MEPRKEKLKRLRATGRLGGIKGGPARALSLTPERRVEIARMAIAARWNKQNAAR